MPDSTMPRSTIGAPSRNFCTSSGVQKAHHPFDAGAVIPSRDRKITISPAAGRC